MKTILKLDEIDETARETVGGKAVALATVAREGLAVPKAMCVAAQVYDRFLEATGLRARIVMEYERKPFDQMRWEEIWDTALRIQNLFINAEIPSDIATPLCEHLGSEFAGIPVVVRSSALGEDSKKASFAGLHESFVNVRGIAAILEHIKLVWASLWSDRAMLYRSEIGLDIKDSKMAVLVQELVVGQKSGVAFGVSPLDESKAVVEAVYGLNQGLVDGTIQPDRWVIDRTDGAIRSHTGVAREKMVVARSRGIAVVSLPKRRQATAPLTSREVGEVYRTGRLLEGVFGGAQDMEWTYRGPQLCLLQSRPITAGTAISKQDNRPWYLSLHRSLENLTELRRDIETKYIPEMISLAQTLAEQDLGALNTEELAKSICDRKQLYTHWQQVYWDYFIPFAHAVRLFGQTYNRMVKPADPYEFARLLPGALLKSVERNRKLGKAASAIGNRAGPRSRQARDKRGFAAKQYEAIAEATRDVDSSTLQALLSTVSVDKQVAFFGELATVAPGRRTSGDGERKVLAKRFVESFPVGERNHAERLLDLARASYRLRDDDNIYLGRIEAELLRSLVEVKRRSKNAAGLRVASTNVNQFVRALTEANFRPSRETLSSGGGPDRAIKARQLIGQPAGEGVAVGRARVVKRPEDLLDFKRGEILVCDAVDPNMTFVVPLAGGIIERRGGMLIHGAIIAREYGLPCVTGVPDVSTLLRTGDRITVDGYLGIVTVGSASDDPALGMLAKPRSAVR